MAQDPPLAQIRRIGLVFCLAVGAATFPFQTAMPKNKLGGNKAKRAKANVDQKKQELVFKEDGQEYGQVMRMLGNGRCEVNCFDGTKRLCHIRGKMRKKSLGQPGRYRSRFS